MAKGTSCCYLLLPNGKVQRRDSDPSQRSMVLGKRQWTQVATWEGLIKFFTVRVLKH